MTTVWYNFQANTCSKKSSTRLFWFTGAKGCCGGSSHEFCGKFNLADVGGSETQTTEKRTRNCSCITITNYYQWSSWSNERSWHLSHCITIPRNHEVMRTFCSKAIIVVLSFLKAGFNKRKSSAGASNLITAMRTNPTWLIFCLRKKETFSVALGNEIIAQYHWRIQSTHMSYNNPMCRFVSASDLF